MSTDPGWRPVRMTRASVAFLALFTVSCLHHTSDQLRAVCAGANIGKHVTLVIDSVTPDANGGLARLRGERFDLLVNLANPQITTRCEDRTGAASATVDELPDELAHATAPKRGGRWWIDGTRVAVDLNPGVPARDLRLFLPLDGSDGVWRLITLAGPVASGRLLMARR